MGKALNKSILSIKLELESFSVLNIIKEQERKSGWTESYKTLVFGPSEMMLNKFTKKIIDDEYGGHRNNIDRVNEKYHFCISYKTFCKTKKYYETVIIINSNEIYKDLVFGSIADNEILIKEAKDLRKTNGEFTTFLQQNINF